MRGRKRVGDGVSPMPNHVRKRPSEMRPEHPTPAIMGNGSCRAMPGLPVTADQAVFAFLFDGREKQQEWHRGSITSRLFFTGDVEVFLFERSRNLDELQTPSR
ncbi:hypothetical protein PMI05_03641 [Brevibacillus sp. BC25]|nr:hypothetical protein PMI05_03641 [Brevibacillus sp. BC25]